MTATRWIRGIAAAAVAQAAGTAATSALGGDTGDETGLALVATTGNHSELRETIPVARRARAQSRVAMSLSPDQLGPLMEGDRLRVSAELQTTNNCYRRTSYCVSSPYRYSPRIGARLVLARGRAVTGGPGAEPISKWRVRDCDQDPGHREHHCVRVFGGSGFKVPAAEKLPCEPDRCRVNLVVEAHHPNARKGDVVLLGIDRKSGRVSGDRGRLNVTRLRGPAVPVRERTERRLRRSRVPIERGAKKVIYSMRLSNLRPREQLTFNAHARIAIDHLSYSTFVGSQLVLTTSPNATHTTRFTRRVGSLDGEVTEANGFNCTQRTTPCPAPKAGTLRILRAATRGDREVPLYVNYVLRNAPKLVDGDAGDAMRIERGGSIQVRRYPPEARG